MIREFTEELISKIKKENFKFDKNISNSYIILKILEYIFCYLRGQFKGIFFGKKSKILLVGKNTTIKCSGKIFVGNNFNIEDNVEIDALSEFGIKCGDNVKIGKGSILKCSGSLKDMGKGFECGSNVYFGNNSFFGAAGGIKIGNDIISGQNVRFHSENHKYNNTKLLIRLQGVTRQGIEIGDNCWIGSGVTILDGVRIGSGIVIAANSLINKNIPDNVVVGGIPCKILKERI